MMLPLASGESTKLPVTVGWPKRGGDGTSMLFQAPEPVVNIAHSQKVLRTASTGGRVVCSGRYVQNRSQAVENIDGCSIRTTIAVPTHAGLIGLRSRLPNLSGTATTMAPAPAAPLGPFLFGADSKKISARNELAFPMQRKSGG